MRQLLLAVALACAAALLDSPGLRGTTQSVVDEPAEPAGQYSVRSTTSGGNACSTTATAQQCLDAAGGHDAQKGPCNY